MARWNHDMGRWRPRPLTIPPDSWRAWMRLALWEMWMGALVCAALAVGVRLVVSSPDRIVEVMDIARCYAPPPVVLPCERIIRLGLMNAAFNTLCGAMLIGVAAWFLWELWRAVEPKPITDDFLRLLDDSFGRNWRNPLTWPWARVWWAYGFTAIGATLSWGVALMIWTMITL